MPRFPIKYPNTNNRYMIWSTIVDAPIMYDCTWEEVRQEWKDERGRCGLESFDRIYPDGSHAKQIDSVCQYNRAGENEESLTRDQLLTKYPHSETTTTS